MIKYIAILRGINVGGRRKLLMADLKSLCKTLKMNNVSTYIQSGNIIFESRDEPDVIEEKLKQTIAKKYNYDVPIIVISVDELIQIRKDNPYLNEDIKQLYYTFLKEAPSSENRLSTESLDLTPDSFTVDKRTAYIDCVKGYSSTRLTNDFFEKKLRVSATTRNAKTVNKLIELAL